MCRSDESVNWPWKKWQWKKKAGGISENRQGPRTVGDKSKAKFRVEDESYFSFLDGLFRFALATYISRDNSP
jgi:hypothetical protein